MKSVTFNRYYRRDFIDASINCHRFDVKSIGRCSQRYHATPAQVFRLTKQPANFGRYRIAHSSEWLWNSLLQSPYNIPKFWAFLLFSTKLIGRQTNQHIWGAKNKCRGGRSSTLMRFYFKWERLSSKNRRVRALTGITYGHRRGSKTNFCPRECVNFRGQIEPTEVALVFWTKQTPFQYKIGRSATSPLDFHKGKYQSTNCWMKNHSATFCVTLTFFASAVIYNLSVCWFFSISFCLKRSQYYYLSFKLHFKCFIWQFCFCFWEHEAQTIDLNLKPMKLDVDKWIKCLKKETHSKNGWNRVVRRAFLLCYQL